MEHEITWFESFSGFSAPPTRPDPKTWVLHGCTWGLWLSTDTSGYGILNVAKVGGDSFDVSGHTIAYSAFNESAPTSLWLACSL